MVFIKSLSCNHGNGCSRQTWCALNCTTAMASIADKAEETVRSQERAEEEQGERTSDIPSGVKNAGLGEGEAEESLQHPLVRS